MIRRQTRIIQFTALTIAFSAALLLGVWLFVSDSAPTWVVIGWSLVWGIAVVTTVIAFIAFLRETAPDLNLGEYHPVSPLDAPLPPATDRRNPWPVDWLAPALARAFEGTPYVVTSNGRSILIHADLADARWQQLATLHSLRHAFVTRLTPTDRYGVIRRTDESRKVETQAGIKRLGAQVAVQSGRHWGSTRRVEYGLGIDGFKKRTDYKFSTNEINKPVKEVLTRAGWRATLDAESKGALIVGALGASAIVIVPIALLLQ